MTVVALSGLSPRCELCQGHRFVWVLEVDRSIPCPLCNSPKGATPAARFVPPLREAA